MKTFSGKVWKFGDNIDTDLIIPARYLIKSDDEWLAQHVMKDADPDFYAKVNRGDIIVGGYNFGSGSSREHAPRAIKAAGVACVIAKSFARIFYRNSFNMGLPILESEVAAESLLEGNTISVDLSSGKIVDNSTNNEFIAEPIPEFMRNLIEAGGLMNYITRVNIP
ncbi:MAG: 3-isopropylmalate dehydratase small subunit [Nitrospinota bacterium]